jgi:hypothetical protein
MIARIDRRKAAMPENVEVLGYGVPQRPDRSLAVGPALCLAAPGGICWAGFLLALKGITVPYGLLFMIWPFAVITALISVAVYFRTNPKRWPWFIYINLVINVSGLLFTVYIWRYGMP